MNKHFSASVTVIVLAVFIYYPKAEAQVYVSKAGDNTLGTSWATALFALGDAVAQAANSEVDVWIDSDTFTILSTVSVPSNVNIYGGFPATGNPGFGDRDPDSHPTSLDGANVASPILEFSGSVGLEIDGITFTNADGNSGGAIRAVSGADIDILNCRFIGNVASSGAGIYIQEAHADVENSVFEDNVAGEAAAIMLFSGTANVIRCEFRRNDGGGQGGAILAYEEPLYVDQCIFEENEAARGGAIAVREGFDVTITNTLFRDNFSSNHGAGINFESQSGIVVANCTFVDNTASTRGGGVFFHSSGGAVSNCIFVNNNNRAIYENDSSADPIVLNNLFYGNPDGVYFDEDSVTIELSEGADGLNTLLAEASGNIDGDPVFVFPEGGDYHIRISSPAVDAGTTANAPAFDIDDDGRPVDIPSVGLDGSGVAYDIGFDEYRDDDGDGMPDYWELLNGLDPDSGVGDDGASGDADSDNLTNLDEYEIHHTGASEPDTDGDGLDDGDEVNTHFTDPVDTDSDNDGLQDGEEVNIYSTDPNIRDTDGDGLNDGNEVLTHGTDPLVVDSDGDGVGDGNEINDGTNPLDPDSFGTSEVWVDFSFEGTPNGSKNAPYKTMGDGNSAVDASGTLHVVSGSSPFAGTLSKPMTIIAEGGSVLLGSP